MATPPEPFRQCMELLSQGSELDMDAFRAFWAEHSEMCTAIDVTSLGK